MQKSTREVSSLQEKKIAKALGGKRTSNSGATDFDKGDIVIGADWLLEAKTCMQPKSSFSIKKDWLIKLKQEQFACNKLHSALCFDFGDSKDRYYIVDEKLFKNIIELMEQQDLYNKALD